MSATSTPTAMSSRWRACSRPAARRCWWAAPARRRTTTWRAACRSRASSSYARTSSDIASYYRAADCYVFPVLSGEGAIALPLSVLEAMACNLPVVSTALRRPAHPLPGLKRHQPMQRDEDTLVSAVVAMRSRGDPQTRRLVQPFSWDAVAQDIMDKVLTGDAELTRDAKGA